MVFGRIPFFTPGEYRAVPTFAAADLLVFVRSLFEAGGVPADEAATVAASLVGANLCGHDSHGVIRVVQYFQALGDGRNRAGVPLLIVKESPAVLVADGQWGLGQVQAHRLLERLVPKARATGLAAGTLKQCGHIGRLGEYAEATAAQGFAFMATVLQCGHRGAVLRGLRRTWSPRARCAWPSFNAATEERSSVGYDERTPLRKHPMTGRRYVTLCHLLSLTLGILCRIPWRKRVIRWTLTMGANASFLAAGQALLGKPVVDQRILRAYLGSAQAQRLGVSPPS